MVRSQAPAATPAPAPFATIAAFARAGGVGVETVRYYQRRGLLAVPDGAGSARRYGEADRRRLRFIRAAQDAGFTLDQVATLLALDRTEDRAEALALARRQLDVLDRRIAALGEARNALARLAARCGAGDDGPCPIIAAFEGEER